MVKKQKLNSTNMGGGDEHCMSLQDKKKKGKCSYTHKVLRKNIMLEFICLSDIHVMINLSLNRRFRDMTT